MSADKEFYLTLPSNVKSFEDTNTVSNYKTLLKQRIVLPADEDWRVGISQFIYSKSWYNVRNKVRIKFLSEFGEDIDTSNFTKDRLPKVFPPDDQAFYISPAYYYDVEELVNVLNNKLISFAALFKITPMLHYYKMRNVVLVGIGVLYLDDSRVIPDFGPEVNNILGLIEPDNLSIFDKIRGVYIRSELKKRTLPDTKRIDAVASEENLVVEKRPQIPKYFQEDYLVAPRVATIRAGFDNIFIYSDIVQHSFVGDAYAQLLEAIPIQDADQQNDMITERFVKPNLTPVLSRNFDTIEIVLKDDTGTNIPFEGGKVIVKLLFRKYE